GVGGMMGSGGDAGDVSLHAMAPLSNLFLGDLFIIASAGNSASDIGGIAGDVDIDSQVTANRIQIIVDGTLGTSVGTAGKVTTAGLTTTIVGQVPGDDPAIDIFARGTIGAMGSGTVTVNGQIVTNASDVSIDAASAVGVRDVTTTAMGSTVAASGNVVLAAGGSATARVVTTSGLTPAGVGDGRNAGSVT